MTIDETAYKVQGFKGSAVVAGLKQEGELDLALIYSENEAMTAGVFTTNRVKAAPVILSRENLRNGKVRAIIANSGNANACTGQDGLEKAHRTAELVAREMDIKPHEVLVASTGVIGSPLNMDLLANAIPDLVKTLSVDGMPRVARAVMTTDSFAKMSRFEGMADGKPYHLLGIAKGAGMIMPDMATMLSFILSDISIDINDLRKTVSSSVETTFNRISVDGDTSTNDMLVVMANGLASNGKLSYADYEGFQKGLTQVMADLATMIVRDGEGATKVIYVNVKGAATDKDAIAAARTVANSNLVKTAFYGQDPNWGRIMAALGRSGIQMKEEDVNMWVGDVEIVKGGVGTGVGSEKEAAEIMAKREFSVTIDLQQGRYKDRIITCDLTHEYITVNAAYRT